MTTLNLAQERLRSQRLAGTDFEQAAQVVRWLGAVQSQDYTAGKWALALRAQGLTDSAIEQSFADGSILRTHVLRPTWHFVAPDDIRWMLALTAPRIHAANALYYRRLEIDRELIARSRAVVAKALRGGQQLTRQDLAAALRSAGIVAAELRLVYLIGAAELDGVITSGARRGKQFTFALLDERVPSAKTLTRDESLAELTRRYFTSHGPATEADFKWWSGLTLADVRRGLQLAGDELEQETVDEKAYWFSRSGLPVRRISQSAFLLPNYDEYKVGYTDRRAIYDPANTDQLDERGNPLFQHTFVINGRIAGTWKRTLKKDAAIVHLSPFVPLTKAEEHALARAARRYGEFLGLPVSLA